jgi:predicted amidohydrolase
MRVFALELDNARKGFEERKDYIEGLIARLPAPDLVVLPELSLCGYMASPAIWQYADEGGREAAAWAVDMARKYDTCIGAGYLDREDGDYYNRYLIASPQGVCGAVTKSEGEAAVFKRGSFGNTIRTPFGLVGVAICYDSRRKHFYENVKDLALTMILFPHGAPADPQKPKQEQRENDLRCGLYADSFGIPVVYVNSVGALEEMPGKMGEMMAKKGFRMNGRSKIYAAEGRPISTEVKEAVGMEVPIHSKKRIRDIPFHGQDILPGNFFFRQFVLKPDTAAGIRAYEEMHLKEVRE